MAVSIRRICSWFALPLVCTAAFASALCAQETIKSTTAATAADDSDKPVKEPAAKTGWRPLLKAGSLDGWEVTQFGGEGEVKAEEGQVVLSMGDPLTGITWKGKKFPTSGFEIKLEAQRIQGNDFLCCLTFPVGDDHASLVCGGWGGGVVGLSSIDGNDASENSTSTFNDFKNGKWYSFRVRVDGENVTAWVDDERVLKQERKGHDFSVRAEVMASRPLGYCAFQSKVALRDVAWRSLTDDAKDAVPAKQDARAVTPEGKDAAKPDAGKPAGKPDVKQDQ